MKVDGKVKCNEVFKCFASKNGYCTCLKQNYPTGKCPFCKDKITDKK